MSSVLDTTFESELRKHLRLLPEETPLGPDDNLMDLGLDSLGTVWLVTDLEALYGIAFSDDDMDPETFTSAATLWARVSRLREAVARS